MDLTSNRHLRAPGERPAANGGTIAPSSWRSALPGGIPNIDEATFGTPSRKRYSWWQSSLLSSARPLSSDRPAYDLGQSWTWQADRATFTMRMMRRNSAEPSVLPDHTGAHSPPSDCRNSIRARPYICSKNKLVSCCLAKSSEQNDRVENPIVTLSARRAPMPIRPHIDRPSRCRTLPSPGCLRSKQSILPM
ncbi:hypothetical protein ABIF38_009072 [Bradyrhizobium japonicum]|nr:hypothetical protein [Bradyrhizobium elkanii]MCP1737395.1 hypothetical protein [Bradyrhizobium elkanii]MCS3572735.1 hypothetical protein [Bradyrhizobium elkanii]MCS3585781.1 hypothetical protein [Bradyrhizobium elkanii]MCS3624015.1 hypothetical protein [Bradyrhizobium elkanii]